MSCPCCTATPHPLEGTSSTITFDSTIGQTVELTSVEAKCGPTQHDYNPVGVPWSGGDNVVLYCGNCGDIRKIEVPSS